MNEPQHSIQQTAADERLEIQKAVAPRLYSKIYDWQTRILLLKAGERDEPLQAELHVANLVHAPGVALQEGHNKRIQYSALS